MSVASMINKVFYALKDKDRVKTNESEILFCLNDANREFRRQLLQVKPSLLNETDTFSTVIGTKEYTLAHQPLRMVLVRYAGRPIDCIKQETIPDLTTTGTPVGYYMVSPTKMALYPIPNAVGTVTVLSIRTATAWTATDITGWVEEVEDGLINYAAAKIAGQPLPALPVTLIVGMIEDAPADVMDGYMDHSSYGGDYR